MKLYVKNEILGTQVSTYKINLSAELKEFGINWEVEKGPISPFPFMKTQEKGKN